MQEEFDIPKEFKLPSKNTIKSMKVLNNKILILIFVLIILVVGFFGYQFIAPFGAKITYEFSSKDADKMSKLDGAVSSKNIDNKATNSIVIPQQIIRQNIVTFNLKVLSKKIDGIWVNLKFKGVPKELKIGVKGSLKEQYTYKPLYEKTLENLKDFENVDNQLIFWQKEKKYKNFNQFLSNPPLDKPIRFYFFDPTEISELQIKSPPSSKATETTINKLLRGSHSFFVRVDNNQLNLTIEKQDYNNYRGADILVIEGFKGEKRIFNKEIFDDGIEEGGGLKLSSQKETIKTPNVENGIYKINLYEKKSMGDLVIKSISVNQAKIAFASPLFITDLKPTELWTNSTQISGKVVHSGYEQTLKIDKSKELQIKEAGKEYSFDFNATGISSSSATAHLIEIPKNDLVIKGDKFFAFDKNSLFDPKPINTTLSDTSSEDPYYIIANYRKVKKDGDWNITQAYFDPKDVEIEGDKLYFSLESPELSNYGGEIAIGSLEVTVNKPGWFSGKEDLEMKYQEGKLEKEQNILDKLLSFLSGIWPFGKEDQPKVESEKKEDKAIPSKSAAPTKKPSPTLAVKESIKISIQNGGATPGTASKYLELLKKEGFKNLEAINASASGYKNATIIFNKDEEKDISSSLEDIKKILKAEYKTINSDYHKDKEAITIILGSLGTLSPSPTVKPK